MTITRHRMHLLPVAALAALLLAVALLASAGHAAAAPRAHDAGSCDISKVSRRLGPTYVTSLRVAHTNCRKGVKVVKAFHACRLKHGVRGRCTHLVKGFACGEQRNGIPTQFSAKVTCRKGRAVVVHTYTQFT